jgi:ATP phosphoribosyltransferase regulatory subunit
MIDIFSLPLGIKEYTTKDVRKIEFISSVVLEESELWGYKKIITPIFEKINSLNLGLREDTINKTIKFIDPLNGDVLGLRSDITPQIARYVSNNFKAEKMPLRLTYNERVVRSNLKETGTKREIFQVGCELIGSSSVESDLEIISLSISILKKLGFKNQVVTLNSSLLLNFIFENLEPIKEDIKLLFHKKDYQSIENFIKDKRLSKNQKTFISKYLKPLIQNKSILSKNLPAKVRESIDRINSVAKILSQTNTNLDLKIDFLDVKNFDYYSGMTFDVAVPEISETVLSGGRYDELIGKYGNSFPAVGLGINILPLIKTVNPDQLGSPVVVVDFNVLDNFSLSLEIKEFFTAQGFTGILSSRSHQYKDKFDLKIKISKNKSLTLFDHKNKKITTFKTFLDLQKEDF